MDSAYFCVMYSKQEAVQLKQEFWTAFGKYMSPVLSADGEKINWLNYKTGEKHIYFRMDADNKKASVGIEIIHKDADLLTLYFEQFHQLKPLLKEVLGEEWNWQPQARNEIGQLISRISIAEQNVNIFNKQDWAVLISFFKPRIIALDQFWSTAKYAFESLR